MCAPMLAMVNPGVVDFDAVKLGRDKTAQGNSCERSYTIPEYGTR